MGKVDAELLQGYLAWQRTLVREYIGLIRSDPIPKEEARAVRMRVNDVTSQLRAHERTGK